ncbi:hypothetical protein BDK51DRAFT_52505 [Blyttiomyces helicus]|uniref:Uncharacterized protein n=1 Tax=Blyttiomyces helicus TaxID=388810 RepID=A0A4P9WJP7_9FUNG|nr:hypothetical protein BDK51DRAFT_52505 [Blyttiomyces helicus]|eukprot:RKO93169.1 hypothetical protein BDK51DRAFT_52505 [Blyttiomyces helicus]
MFLGRRGRKEGEVEEEGREQGETGSRERSFSLAGRDQRAPTAAGDDDNDSGDDDDGDDGDDDHRAMDSDEDEDTEHEHEHDLGARTQARGRSKKESPDATCYGGIKHDRLAVEPLKGRGGRRQGKGSLKVELLGWVEAIARARSRGEISHITHLGHQTGDLDLDLAGMPHTDIERQGRWTNHAIDNAYLDKLIPIRALRALTVFCWEGLYYHLARAAVVHAANTVNPRDPQLAAAEFLAPVEMLRVTFLQDSVFLMDLPGYRAHPIWTLPLFTSNLFITFRDWLRHSVRTEPLLSKIILNQELPERNQKVNLIAKVLSLNVRLILDNLSKGFTAMGEEFSNLSGWVGLMSNLVSSLGQGEMQVQAIQVVPDFPSFGGAPAAPHFAADGAAGRCGSSHSFASRCPEATTPSGTPATSTPESPTPSNQAPALQTGDPVS